MGGLGGMLFCDLLQLLSLLKEGRPCYPSMYIRWTSRRSLSCGHSVDPWQYLDIEAEVLLQKLTVGASVPFFFFFWLEEKAFTGQGHAETNLDKPT